MYRKGLEYDEMAKKVIDIYLDYNIKTFPINVNQVCQKMQIALKRTWKKQKSWYVSLWSLSVARFFCILWRREENNTGEISP